MKKPKVISVILLLLSFSMMITGVIIQRKSDLESSVELDFREVNINNIAYSGSVIRNDNYSKRLSEKVVESEMEVAPASVIIPPRVEVYDNLTLEELSAKLDKNLGTDYIAGKGSLIASQCIEKGVDPYLAVAIILHETGCGSRCSSLTRNCNNVGGQKGAPSCGRGVYRAFSTLDEGIIGFITNLSENYYAKGLNTVEAIGSKYAEGKSWPTKINSFIEKIRAS